MIEIEFPICLTKYEKMNILGNRILTISRFILFWSLSIISTAAVAQDKNAVFAFVNKSEIQSDQESKQSEARLIPHRRNIVQKVLDDLVEAIGDSRIQKPRLVLNNKTRHVAWIDPNKLEIGIESKAYNICRSFGPDSLNAIATLLGHELIHYYNHHNWTREFIRKNPDLRSTKKLESVNERLKFESQADHLGTFIGQSAGYNSLYIMPELLQRVYDGYDLSPNLPGYPSLQERIEISRSSMDKAKNLLHINDLSHYLILMGRFEEAKDYLSHLLRDFQSREVYNNLGVASFLRALAMTDPKTQNLIYPIELDPDSRLNDATKGFDLVNDSMRMNNYLDEAIQNFKKAITLDRDYVQGFINIACAQTLRKEFFDAKYYAQKAMNLAVQKEDMQAIASAHLILGNIAFKEGNEGEAKKQFQDAIRLGDDAARINMGTLNENFSYMPSKNIEMSTPPERIDGKLLDDMVNFEPDGRLTLEEKYLCAFKELENSKILVSLNNDTGKYFITHFTNTEYRGQSSLNIKLGHSEEVVESKYGKPSGTLRTSKGKYVLYDKKNLFFQFDHGDSVIKWGTYRSN